MVWFLSLGYLCDFGKRGVGVDLPTSPVNQPLDPALLYSCNMGGWVQGVQTPPPPKTKCSIPTLPTLPHSTLYRGLFYILLSTEDFGIFDPSLLNKLDPSLCDIYHDDV